MFRSFCLFVAAYETGSFTAAARRENATQSGVSQHIRALERRHGSLLFERTGGSVQPTPAADVFYHHCVAALRAVDDAGAALRFPRDELSGTAVIGLMPTVTAAALAPALLEFRALHPRARVRIVEAFSQTLTERTLAGELDFAIVPAMPPPKGLRTAAFVAMDEMFVARHAVGEMGRPVLLAGLPPLRLILPEEGNVRAGAIRSFVAARGATIAETIEIDSMMATLDLISRSDWCAILPSLLMISPRHGSALSVQAISDPPRLELITIEPARRTMSPVASAFRACLEHVCTMLLK